MKTRMGRCLKVTDDSSGFFYSNTPSMRVFNSAFSSSIFSAANAKLSFTTAASRRSERLCEAQIPLLFMDFSFKTGLCCVRWYRGRVAAAKTGYAKSAIFSCDTH